MMSDRLENRVDKLEDSINSVSQAIQKMELLLENQQKESERHHRKMESIVESQQTYQQFMALTNERLEQIQSGKTCKVHSDSVKKDMQMLDSKVKHCFNKITKLTDFTQDNTAKGCAALKLAISEDEVSKNDLKHLTAKVDEISANITWLWRAVAGSMIAVAVKMFVL
jgi:translation elongation factor EF-1beta